MILNKKQTISLIGSLNYISTDSNKSGTYIISGNAGTGKSVLLTKLYDNLFDLDYQINVLAPTGKAVYNLKQKSSGMSPTTIHSLMFSTILGRRMVDGIMEDYYYFKKRDPVDIRADCDIILLDEGSMLGRDMFSEMKKIGVPIIIFGDHNQLPSFEYGNNGFNVMITSVDNYLTEVERTTMDSAIFKLAYSILVTGRLHVYDYGSEVEFLSKNEFNHKFIQTHDIDAVIVHSNNERKAVNRDFRLALYGLTDDDLPVAGEKIMCLNNQVFTHKNSDNNVTGTGVYKYNGQIETLTSDAIMVGNSTKLPLDGATIELETSKFLEYVPYKVVERVRFCFGYALTVHKSQGSEFDNMVIILPSGFVLDNYIDDAKAWLYTAVTRAKKKLWIVVN